MKTATPTTPKPGDVCSELRANRFTYTCKTCGLEIRPSLNAVHFKWTESRHPFSGGVDPVTRRFIPTHFWDVTHWTHLNCC